MWISDIRKWFSDIRKSISDIRNWFSDIRNYFLISENTTIFWYQKSFSEIRKWFRISENRGIFWYQEIISDIRNHFLISENRNFPWCLLRVLYYVCSAWEQTRSWPNMVTNKLPVYLERRSLGSLGHEQSRECNELYAQLQNIHANHTNCTK